jgi:hypothetical protein
MQGPADVCGKLLGYENMLLGAYTSPDLFHELMRTVTDVFVMVWEAQRELLGDLFVPTHLNALSWVPNDRRASVSVDSLDMIGPDFYDEYFRPHLVNLGERLGALTVHSCGDPTPVLPKLLDTPHVAGVNAAQRTLAEVVDAGVGSDCVIVASTPLGRLAEDIALIRERQLRVDLKIGGIWPKSDDGEVLPPDAWGPEIQEVHKRVVDACRL